MPLRRFFFEVLSPEHHAGIDPTPLQPWVPSRDPDPAARTERLRAAREDYQYRYDYDNAPTVPLLDSVPVAEYFSLRYILETGETISKIKLNDALNGWPKDGTRATNLDRYAEIFKVLDMPSVAREHLWAHDESFGEQRLSGANPGLIQRARKAADVSGMLPDDPKPFLGHATLEQEVAAGRVFFVDHAPRLDAIRTPGAVKLGPKTFTKYLYKTAGVFWWNRFKKRLDPVSILLRGTEAGDQVVTPRDDASRWLAAKLAFQAADGVVHEMSSHLGRTHLVMEGVAIASHRQLDEHHPVLRLLMPHFRFMLSLNNLAERSLIAPGSKVDASFGAPIEEIVGVAAQARASWDFTAAALPNDLADRGVGGTGGLPSYAYRDDALPLWAATRDYVEDYVGLYYGNDAAVRNDPELQAWAVEIGAGPDGTTGGADLKGFPALDHREQLVFALTQIVFTCSAQHSAVNYGQEDYLAYAPNSPFALWAPLDDTAPVYLDLLPPLGPAEGQQETLSQLTGFRYDKLGDYAEKYTLDSRANGVIRAFARRLTELDSEVAARNLQRWQPYPYLQPRMVLNSISI